MRVALADDAILFREGLARILTEAGFEVVGQVGTAEGLLALVREASPQVAVVDIRMPPTQTTEGLEVAVRIREERPDIGVLLLSQYVQTQHVMMMLQGGARGLGYLLKDRVSDLDMFCDSVRAVAAGRSVIDPDVISELVSTRRSRDLLRELSDRERDVLALMAEGRSNLAIGQRLVLSTKTVEAHVRSIMMKLDLEPAPDDHRRILAVLTYLRSDRPNGSS
jgi:DNA-binding NarL/FixJ family response regulator